MKNETLKEYTKRLIEKYDIKPVKGLGQNFLIDDLIASKVADSLIIQNKEDSLLEVGPGLGAITKLVKDKSNHFTVVDKDKNMISVLCQEYINSGINFVQGDFLKEDISSYKYIVSNLPYNITTDAILKILLEGKELNETILMIQVDAYKRLASPSGDKEYRPISVLFETLGKLKKLFLVSPNSFTPKPGVNSVVFSFKMNKNFPYDKKEFYRFLAVAFRNPRSTILNNLSSLHLEKEIIGKCLQKEDILPNYRPHQIKAKQYLDLFALFLNEKKTD